MQNKHIEYIKETPEMRKLRVSETENGRRFRIRQMKSKKVYNRKSADWRAFDFVLTDCLKISMLLRKKIGLCNMVKNEFIMVDNATLSSIYTSSKSKIADISAKYGVPNSEVINILVRECQSLIGESDYESVAKYSKCRDIIIGNYSLFLIKVYNHFAKKYCIDGNDLMHIPYSNFDNIVKNYDFNNGTGFYSFMMMSLQGYIHKYLNDNKLIRVNPALKFTPKYVGLTKTGADGDDIEYLFIPEDYDPDVNGKLDFMLKISKDLPHDLQELYKYMLQCDYPPDAYKLYAEIHSCKYAKVKSMAEKIRRIATKKWSEYLKKKKIV